MGRLLITEQSKYSFLVSVYAVLRKIKAQVESITSPLGSIWKIAVPDEKGLFPVKNGLVIAVQDIIA